MKDLQDQLLKGERITTRWEGDVQALAKWAKSLGKRLESIRIYSVSAGGLALIPEWVYVVWLV